MANDLTSAKTVTLRDRVGDWIFKHFWHSDMRPSPMLVREYTKVLMNVAAADGVLADAERKWILGNFLAKGGADEDVEFFEKYTPSKQEIEETLNVRPTFVQEISRAILFESFQAASADDELHKDERNAIFRLGEIMNMSEAEVNEIEELFNAEVAHRKRVVDIMFPKGIKGTCDVSIHEFVNK
ncbi:unnamed protein product [Adineta ricciae]|uniref:Co-chaperone DjlA N-terminal domain-containing protein n=1 Tax=Adineta ricciae TaxID=249248 RepID=A0A815US75_ADIRI|nr:unnamed protein product [Adineta ricciae]